LGRIRGRGKGKRKDEVAMKRLFLLIMSIYMFLAIGCAQVKQYTPQIVPIRYSLDNLSLSHCSVDVHDLRPDGSDRLSEILRAQVLSAMSDKSLKNYYKISIDIIAHSASFTFGNWNGLTKLRINILDQNNKSYDSFESIGTASRSNLFGYTTAEEVSQDAYNTAISDMFSKLSQTQLE
jgi:hypothetical protein